MSTEIVGRKLPALAAGMLVALHAVAAAADIDAAFQAALSFEYGKDAAPLELIERQVFAASGDAARRSILEERLAAALAGAETRDAKEFFCRQLRAIGSSRSVPALEAMLGDTNLSSLARLALEGIDDRSAGEALARASRRATGRPLAGILVSLGRRGSPDSVPAIVPHLTGAGEEVARAAAGALGAIGGTDAVAALARARSGAPAVVAVEIDDALLAAAERFLAAGAVAEAAGIYRGFLASDKPRHQRMGALDGLVAAGDAAALDLTISALRDPDAEVRLGAVEASRTLRRHGEHLEPTTRALAGVLPSLAPETQALLVHAIASRGGAEALLAVRAAAASAVEPVRMAAFDELARLGDAADAEQLLRWAADPAVGDKGARSARASLLRLQGDRLAAALERIAPLAIGDAPGARAEAIAFLGAAGRTSELEALARWIVSPREPSDRDRLETAFASALERTPAKQRAAEPLLASLRQAPAAARPALVRLLGKVGDAAALAEVRSRLDDDDAATRAAALGTLAGWPDAAPAEELLTLAGKLTDPAGRETALRGFVRLSSQRAESVEPFRRALEIAARPQERAIVLAGLGAVGSTEALDLLEAAAAGEDPALREAAARSLVAVADRVRGLDGARARAAVEKAWAASPDAEVRRRGQAVIDQIEKLQGHLLAWAVSGPYQEEGKDARALFDAALLPETPAAREAPWRRLRRGVGDWDIDLAQALGPADNVAAFVRAAVTSPAERDVRLELGSDDGVKVWLNGTLVHTHFTSRALHSGDDRVDVKLKQGTNELLLKVVNISGPWGFSCRVRGADGALVRDLRAAPALKGSGGDDFRPLFDGKSLDGWEQKGGKAVYRVEDGAIVGHTVPNTPNSFLCTRERHGDFILEYEFRCDAALNSGVQIRSNAYDVEKVYEVDGKKVSVPAGRVHGYQVEIDPNQPERAWVGCVYDEGRRGWLFPGSRGGDPGKLSEQGRRLYKRGEWNHVRVEAVGPSIKTWLNGELRADLTDDLTAEGFIALQVHGVGGRKEPLEVRWRNLQIAAPGDGAR